jgi:hypothetical protein
MRKIKRISPRSLAKVSAFLYGLVGLIGGLIFLVVSLVALLSGHSNGWFGLFAIVLLPIGYGILGLIFGYLSALLYNFASKKVGGIEFEVE